MTEVENVETANDNEQSDASGVGGTLFDRLGWMGAMVLSPGVSRGDRAALRRMRVGDIPPEVYWRLTGRLDPVPTGKDEDFWMTVTALMARYPHRRGGR